MLSRIHVGIDVSKNWFDACARVGRETRDSRFDQTQRGVADFLRWLKEFGARTCHVCMEHTGGYEAELALACFEANFGVSLVDGTLIKRYRQSFSRTRAKTDKSDARLLADYCKERRPALWAPRPQPYEQLTELIRHRQDLVGDKVAWASRASHSCKSELVAQQRAALREVQKAMIKEVEKAVKELVKSSPELSEDVELLDSIEGIAFTSATRILAEMGPVSNYRTPRDLALQAGLTPIPSESGMSTGKSFLPTYGNRELRTALYWPVVAAMKRDKEFAQFTKRVNANGNKTKMTVLTAGMRKLAHVIHGVLSHRTPYSPDIFLGNMARTS